MKEIDDNNQVSAAKSKTNNKVFYFALGICIIALAGAIYIGVSSTMNKLTQEGNANDTSQTQSEQLIDDIADVTKPESNIAVSEDSAQTEVHDEIKTDIPIESPIEEATAAPAAPTFIMPVEGDVITPFSAGELVKSKTLKEWRTHDGIDIKAVANAPVRAACAGMVDEVTTDPMWGTCVTISHEGNYQSFYKGLKPAVSIKAGQKINQGDVIGYIGNTAEIEIAEESHLHFAVKKDGNWSDPISLLSNN